MYREPKEELRSELDDEEWDFEEIKDGTNEGMEKKPNPYF